MSEGTLAEATKKRREFVERQAGTVSPTRLLRPICSLRSSVFCILTAGFWLLDSGSWLLSSYAAEPQPLINVHAHNDYEHKRPLFDALDHGFCSVEADIHLVEGQLLVAHSRSQVETRRTLEALYLDPLHEQVKKNGGHVFPNGPEFVLLIDVKGDWRAIYPVLREKLKQYQDILSTFHGGTKQTNAILAIITGDRSKAMFDGETIRYAALDGTLSDLDSAEPSNLIPWISSDWTQTFKWRAAGNFPEAEKLKLKDIVAKAHQQGRKVRFWGSPDNATFWQEMLTNGVDLINTDDLEGAQKFLLKLK